MFEKHKYAEAILGELDSHPVAFSLFFHNYSTWTGYPGIWLEELFILPEYRKRGFGTMMI